MYTTTTVTMAVFDPNFGKMFERGNGNWGSIHEPRYENIFKDEIANVERGEEGVFFEWGCIPAELVDSMSKDDKLEFLEMAQRGWCKLTDHGNFSHPWHLEDMVDVGKSCQVALALIDAHLELMVSYVPQGPLRPEDTPCTSSIARRQAMLDWATPAWDELRRTIIENVLPNVEDARIMLRSRMGQVDLTGEYYCIGCDKLFSGSEGFVVLDAPRRGSNSTAGVKCLNCFGH